MIYLVIVGHALMTSMRFNLDRVAKVKIHTLTKVFGEKFNGDR